MCSGLSASHRNRGCTYHQSRCRASKVSLLLIFKYMDLATECQCMSLHSCSTGWVLLGAVVNASSDPESLSAVHVCT